MIFTPDSSGAHYVVRPYATIADSSISSISEISNPGSMLEATPAPSALSRRLMLSAGPLALVGALAGCSAAAQESASSTASDSASAEGAASPTPKPTQHIPTTGYLGPIIFTSEPSPHGAYEPATLEHGPKNYPWPVVDESLWKDKMVSGSYAVLSAYCQIEAFKFAGRVSVSDIEFYHPDEEEFWKEYQYSEEEKEVWEKEKKRTGTYGEKPEEWVMNYQPSYIVKKSPTAEKNVSFHGYIWSVRLSVPNYTIVRHDDQGKPVQELVRAYHQNIGYPTIYRDGRWWMTTLDYLNARMSANYKISPSLAIDD